MSKDAGISGDEHFHIDHAENVWNFYKTLGKDKTALHNNYTLHQYGQSLDNLVHIFNEIFGVDDIYSTRHFFNAIVGWILILSVGLISATLFGWQAGYIALLLMFFSPRILGHSFNNLKDIPFAAAYSLTLYFLIRFIQNLPDVKLKHYLPIILGIAWAISIRIGGIILIPYFFLFYGLYFISGKNFLQPEQLKRAFKQFLFIAAACIGAYFIGLILWPFALVSPLKNPLLTLSKMTNYGMNLNQLFEGTIQNSQDLPWYYGIKYIAITTPLIIGIGLVIFIWRLLKSKGERPTYINYFILFFAFIFPLAYTIYQNSNLYGGWRHLLWIYGPLVALSSGGFGFLLLHKSKWMQYVTVLILAIGLLKPVIHTVKNHPHQYIYYNQLVGGINGANGKYEMDYYYHGIRECAEFLKENIATDKEVTVVSDHPRIAQYLLKSENNINFSYCRYHEKNKTNWDYAIWTNTHIHPTQLKNGLWPPKGTKHEVKVDSVCLATLVKRISYDDIEGFQAMRQNKFDEAETHFNKFLEVYPEAEEVWEGLAIIYKLRRRYDIALEKINKSIELNPGQLSAYVHQAEILNNLKRYNDALEVANKALSLNPTIYEGLYQKGIALKNMNNPGEAIRAFQDAININHNYYRAYYEIGEVLINYKNFEKATGIYKQVLEAKKNDLLGQIGLAKCYHFMNNNEMTLKLMQQLPPNSNNHIEVLKLQCRLAIHYKDMQRASAIIRRFQRDTTDSEIYVIKALYEVRNNQISTAMGNLEKAVELDPVNREAKGLLDSLNNAIKPKEAETKKQNDQSQSIMFQEQNKKQTSPITFPAK